MNLIVSRCRIYSASSLHCIPGNPLWPYHHPCRTTSPASAFTHKGPARTGPRTHQTRTEREKVDNGHQEECKSRSTGLIFHLSRQHNPNSMSCCQNACKVMAKDLVRTRRYVHKFYQMRTQLQAVSLRIQTLRSNQQMAEAMRGATRASHPNPGELLQLISVRNRLCHL
jgi:hypothetical protein